MFELFSLYKLAFIGQCCVLLSILSYIALIFNSRLKYQYLFFILSACGLWGSYGVLTTAFVLDDFSLRVVVDHTSVDTPILYKIVGVWGASAGSFHLWICLLSTVGLFLKNTQAWKFFAFHMIGFLCFQFIVSPPFETVSGFVSGGDLNPLLQDKSMVFHPPILYVGYLIFSYIFFAANDSIIVLKRAYQVGFFILTLGIMLGSYWAYYELGWGGFWYWDPVEVISLIPWMFYLLGFHLLKRTNYTQILRYISLTAWPVILICFALVRSGVLSSVHSFAADPAFLINFVIFFVCSVIPVLFFHFKQIQKNNLDALRQTLYSSKVIPFIMWVGILFILVLSVFVPIFVKDVYFGPEFFKATVWPLMLPTLALMSIVPFRAYSFERLLPGFLGAGIMLFFLLGSDQFSILSIVTFCLCGFGVSVSIYNFICDKRFNKKYITMLFGHVGWYALITSCILTTDLGFEEFFTLTEEQRQVVLSKGVQLVLKNLQPNDGSNYKGHKATIDVVEKGGVAYKLYPEIHYFMTTHTTHSRMSIHTKVLSQSAIAIENINTHTLKGVYYDRPYIQGVWWSVFIILLALLFG
jgi:cytochrome c-type biogenesis protein CcmF